MSGGCCFYNATGDDDIANSRLFDLKSVQYVLMIITMIERGTKSLRFQINVIDIHVMMLNTTLVKGAYTCGIRFAEKFIHTFCIGLTF